MMKPEHFEWLDQPKHKLFMYSSQKITQAEKNKLYEIYNDITSLDKKPNGCGRCLRNTVKLIKHYYENYQKI